MRLRIHVIWLLAALALLASARAFAQGAEQEISRLEDLRYEAMIKVDIPTFESLLADDFVYHQASGNVATKKSYAEMLKSGQVKIKSAKRYDVTTRFYGDTAVVMGKTDVDVNIKGEDKAFKLLYLNVWVKRDNRWLLVGRESTFQAAPK